MSSPKKENPSLLGQLLEMFGMSWASEEVHAPPPQPKGPTCRSCGNRASFSQELNRWICSSHPHAEVRYPTHDSSSAEIVQSDD